MNELPWASPEALGRLTISQILSIGHAKPPGTAKPLENFEEFQAEMARIEQAGAMAEREWTRAGKG